jgi:hypothetical protein
MFFGINSGSWFGTGGEGAGLIGRESITHTFSNGDVVTRALGGDLNDVVYIEHYLRVTMEHDGHVVQILGKMDVLLSQIIGLANYTNAVWASKDYVMHSGQSSSRDMLAFGVSGRSSATGLASLPVYTDLSFEIPVLGYAGISVDVQVGRTGVVIVPGFYVGTPGVSLGVSAGDPSTGFQSTVSGGYIIGGMATVYSSGPNSYGVNATTPGVTWEFVQYGINANYLLQLYNNYLKDRKQ